MTLDLPWLLFISALLLGGFVKGALGVGLPLVAVPLLSLGMSPHLAIGLMVAPVLVSNLWQAFQNAQPGPALRRFGGLMLAQAIATVFTVRMTMAMSADQLSTMVAGIVLLAVALMVWQPKVEIPPRGEQAASVGVGLVSGLLGGVSSLTGPVIITYLVALRLGRDAFVGAISLIYLASALPLYGTMAALGRFGTRELLLSLLALLPMAAGLMAGQSVRRRLNDERFRHVLLAFLVVLALLLILK